MLENILNKCGIAILVSVVSFIVGIALGFQLKEDQQGAYLVGHYPDGTPIFILGSRTAPWEALNIAEMNPVDSNALFSILEGLPAESTLGSRLRRVALDGNGPFNAIPVSVNIHLVDESVIRGPIAKACKNSVLFENPIMAYAVASRSEQNDTIPVKGLLKIQVQSEYFSECNSSNEIPEIWASKAYIEKWIKAESLENNSITVKAKMIISTI